MIGRKTWVDPELKRRLNHGRCLSAFMSAFYYQWLQEIARYCDGNLSVAAELAGLDRSNFKRIARRHGVHITRRWRRKRRNPDLLKDVRLELWGCDGRPKPVPELELIRNELWK